MLRALFLRKVLNWNPTYPIDINATKIFIGVCAVLELTALVLSFALGVKGQVELVLVSGFSCFGCLCLDAWLFYEPSYKHYKILIVLTPLSVMISGVCSFFQKTWSTASQQLCADIYSFSSGDYNTYCDSLLRYRRSFYILLIFAIVLRLLAIVACVIGLRRHRKLMVEAMRVQKERRERRERLKAQKAERDRRQKQFFRRELKSKVRKELIAKSGPEPSL